MGSIIFKSISAVPVVILTFHAGGTAALAGVVGAVKDMAAAVNFLFADGTGVPALRGAVLPAVAVHGVTGSTIDTGFLANGTGGGVGTGYDVGFHIALFFRMIGTSAPVFRIVMIEGGIIVTMVEIGASHIGSITFCTDRSISGIAPSHMETFILTCAAVVALLPMVRAVPEIAVIPVMPANAGHAGCFALQAGGCILTGNRMLCLVKNNIAFAAIPPVVSGIIPHFRAGMPLITQSNIGSAAAGTSVFHITGGEMRMVVVIRVRNAAILANDPVAVLVVGHIGEGMIAAFQAGQTIFFGRLRCAANAHAIGVGVDSLIIDGILVIPANIPVVVIVLLIRITIVIMHEADRNVRLSASSARRTGASAGMRKLLERLVTIQALSPVISIVMLPNGIIPVMAALTGNTGCFTVNTGGFISTRDAMIIVLIRIVAIGAILPMLGRIRTIGPTVMGLLERCKIGCAANRASSATAAGVRMNVIARAELHLVTILAHPPVTLRIICQLGVGMISAVSTGQFFLFDCCLTHAAHGGVFTGDGMVGNLQVFPTTNAILPMAGVITLPSACVIRTMTAGFHVKYHTIGITAPSITAYIFSGSRLSTGGFNDVLQLELMCCFIISCITVPALVPMLAFIGQQDVVVPIMVARGFNDRAGNHGTASHTGHSDGAIFAAGGINGNGDILGVTGRRIDMADHHIGAVCAILRI